MLLCHAAQTEQSLTAWQSHDVYSFQDNQYTNVSIIVDLCILSWNRRKYFNTTQKKTIPQISFNKYSKVYTDYEKGVASEQSRPHHELTDRKQMQTLPILSQLYTKYEQLFASAAWEEGCVLLCARYTIVNSRKVVQNLSHLLLHAQQ